MSAKTLAAEGAGPRHTPLVFRPRTIVLASLVASVALAAVGSIGEVCLGDECAHVRHVRTYMQTGRRVPYDPRFADYHPRAVPFSGTPLWHAGLAVLWKLAGETPQVLAQAYHAGFYLLLLLSVYFGARRAWGAPEAGWAWLLAATLPVVCAYSVLLYQDVPGVALTALGLLLLWRGNYLTCGAALAGAYLTKMNALSWAPWAVGFAAWAAGRPWRRRVWAAAQVALPVAAAFGYDMAWRAGVYENLMGYASPPDSGVTVGGVRVLEAHPSGYVRWKPYPVQDLTSIVSHLGPFLLAGAVLALFRCRGRMSAWLWGALALALAGFAAIFVPRASTQVRYLLPAALALVYLAGRALGPLRLPGWAKAAVVAGCVVQAAAATGFVAAKRRIAPEEEAGYAWIRRHTPADARVLFPEQLLTNRTGRVYIWGAANPSYLLTEATDRQRRVAMRALGITHVAVPLRRVYDREAEGTHAGGYPRDFVEALPDLPDFERVYANPRFRVYRFVDSR